MLVLAPQTKRPPLARTLATSAARVGGRIPRQAGAANRDRCPTLRGLAAQPCQEWP
jgi:hypothetical protein